jgi:hypothetical protein
MATKPRQSQKPLEAYQATPQEKAACDAVNGRMQARVNPPKVDVSFTTGNDGISVVHIELGHKDKSGFVPTGLLMETFGAASPVFVNNTLLTLAHANSKGDGQGGMVVDNDQLNATLAVMAGMKPRDELEAMLIAQMCMVQHQIAFYSRSINMPSNHGAKAAAEAGFNKLCRTFTTQLESFKRYRTGGTQKVTVEHQHVHVNEGGQAVINSEIHQTSGAGVGRGGSAEKAEQPHGITYAPGETLPCDLEAVAEAVQRAGR